MISAYYYSKDGTFNQSLLKKIDQFPTNKYLEGYKFDKKIPGETCKFWIDAQEKINLDKKVKFLKTHNAFGKLNNSDFTNNQNSLGCIYVVRDPRNVITSLKNHYQLDDEKAFSWMTNEKNYIYNILKFNEMGYSDFQFISSWSTNYKSWNIQKKIPVKLIKYEDLLNSTYAVFLDILNFISKITNNSQSINKNKIRKTLRSTTFDALKKSEQEHGFSEAVRDREDRNKTVPFFNLGPKNDWKKILDEEFKKKIQKVFEKDLKDLNYK
jgi:hypothetical protein